MLLLGIDVGTSSVKVSVVDAASKRCVASAQYPETESCVIALQPGWAEQSPNMWWEHVQSAILQLHSKAKYEPKDIAAIGIAYQMHGLVMVDANQHLLRDSIIWCDGRAVDLGDRAFEDIGKEKCLSHLLNSPGNFTASKLGWVKQNEPRVYAMATTIMLPGDFIAMKLTGNITTSIAALSEGVFWDFRKGELSNDVFNYYGISTSLIPEIREVFAEHGRITASVAASLSLKAGIPVTYKAGDQPNNALSLNVLEPGDVAASAGTSGVIYGVSDQLTYDNESRVNTFAHVNHMPGKIRTGVLVCINGTGIFNRWIKNITGDTLSYQAMNGAAATIPIGSEGLSFLPFGNGAERILKNKTIGAHLHNINLNKHHAAHLYRAAQEGIAFAFRYGFDIMRENGMHPKLIRAGNTSMFLSNVFKDCFVNTLKVPLELYNSNGSIGAALAAGIGAKFYADTIEAFNKFEPIEIIEPDNKNDYEIHYERWLEQLHKQLS